MKPYRILIADDHSLVRQGIKSIIHGDSSLKVVAEAGDGLQTLALLAQWAPEMVVVDISMPHLSGIEAIGKMRKISPLIRILVLTMHSGNQYVYQAFAAGAHGFMTKDESETELLTAINTIRNGRTYISPLLGMEIADDMLTAFREQNRVPFIDLSKREKEVLYWVAKGCSSKMIGEKLRLSSRTVDHHRGTLLKKFKVKNSVDLVNHAVKCDLVVSDDKNEPD